MSHILTLITQQGADLLTNAFLEGLTQDLTLKSPWTCLGENEAYEVEIQDPVEAAHVCQKSLSGLTIDYAITTAANRRKGLLIADMDSTMIGQECIDEIADHLGVKDQVAGITERAMNGEIPFENALEERVKLLRGLPVSDIDIIFDERITYTAGGKTLVQTMRAAGHETAVVSGGFTQFTDRVAAALGFQASQANLLGVAGDILDGTVGMPILGANAKRQALIQLCSQYGISADDVIAVGDGANDLEMIALAGLGVAFHAKPIVSAEADVSITHTDLTSLLFVQGYTRDEFA